MPAFTAFLDANVLYPAQLRNLLMYLAIPGIYRPRWSEHMQEEWISNLLESRPDLTRAQLERTRQLMNKHVPDALVTGYEQFIHALTLPRSERSACPRRGHPWRRKRHRDKQP